MKIYKVCGNYLKGVQEFEIQKINPDNTFIYEKEGVKKEFTLEVYGGEIPNVKPAFDEEHFLGGEITKKWNTFLCNYTHTYEVEVGLSSSGTEFRKPAVFKAVERVNKYVKKSYKSQHMTKEEAIRIMSHVLDCANIICLESDTAALEEAAGDANTAEEALAFFDHIKLINV